MDHFIDLQNLLIKIFIRTIILTNALCEGKKEKKKGKRKQELDLKSINYLYFYFNSISFPTLQYIV